MIQHRFLIQAGNEDISYIEFSILAKEDLKEIREMEY